MATSRILVTAGVAFGIALVKQVADSINLKNALNAHGVEEVTFNSTKTGTEFKVKFKSAALADSDIFNIFKQAFDKAATELQPHVKQDFTIASETSTRNKSAIDRSRRPRPLAGSLGDGTTYTVKMFNQTALPYIFVLTRKKPNYLSQGQVVVAWNAAYIAAYGYAHFSFTEKYNACFVSDYTTGATDLSGGQIYPATLGSYFTVQKNNTGYDILAPGNPPSGQTVPSTDIDIDNLSDSTQCVGVGINGAAIGYITDAQENVTSTFQFTEDMWCYCATDKVSLGDIVTEQGVTNLCQAVGFNSSNGVIQFTLDSTNVLACTYPPAESVKEELARAHGKSAPGNSARHGQSQSRRVF